MGNMKCVLMKQQRLSVAMVIYQPNNMMPVTGRFVVLMYDRGTICTGVDEACEELFTTKGTAIYSLCGLHNHKRLGHAKSFWDVVVSL